MAWTARYNATFGPAILDQLIAIIQRDQASAIASVDSTLAAIAEFHKGPGPRLQVPYLMLALDSTRFVQADWDVRHSINQISLALDVGDFSQENVVMTGQKYALVLDRVITTSAYRDLTDFTTALSFTDTLGIAKTTAPPAAGTVKEVFVESHEYAVVTNPERETPLLRVTLRLIVEMEET